MVFPSPLSIPVPITSGGNPASPGRANGSILKLLCSLGPFLLQIFNGIINNLKNINMMHDDLTTIQRRNKRKLVYNKALYFKTEVSGATTQNNPALHVFISVDHCGFHKS